MAKRIPSDMIEDRSTGEKVSATLSSHATQLADTEAEISNVIKLGVYVEDFPIIAPEVDDTARLQRAIDEAKNTQKKVVYLAGRNYTISNTITLYEHIILTGQGTLQTIIDCSASGFAFEYITNNGTGEKQSPHFYRMRIKANNGIKLNDPNNGFTNGTDSQCYMMRTVIQDCIIEAKTANSGIGISGSMVFDGNIERNVVKKFDINIDLHGCDITNLRSNRLALANTAQIKLTSYASFGSGGVIEANDILNNSTSGGSMIITSHRHIRILNNYFEQTSQTLESVIKITGGYTHLIHNNRIEVPAAMATNWLKVTNTTNLFWLNVKRNSTTGSKPGAVSITGNVKYWYNTFYKRKIVFEDNSNGFADGIPYNTVEAVKKESIDIEYLCNPNYFIGKDGLKYGDYGVNVEIEQESFSLPPTATSSESLVYFFTEKTGNFDIYFEAKSDVDGQIVNAQIMDGDTVNTTKQIGLTTGFKKYSILLGKTASTNLKVRFFNTDQTNNGKVFLKQVEVRKSEYDSVAPSTGFHQQGEIVWNKTASASGKVGWVCVAEGTPGTWKPFGVIDA